MNFSATGTLGVMSCLLALLLPARVYSDFTVLNTFAEVGVVAGDNSDGYGGHGFADVFLSVNDSGTDPNDFQQADAAFVLALDENTPLGEFVVTYDSEVLVTTGGIGNANALANGIIVFSLSEQFEVISHLGESILNDSLGETIVIPDNSPILLSAGVYSLSFGSSAAIQDGDPLLKISNSQSGLVSFNSTAVPEPAASSLALMLLGFSLRRRRRQ